MDELNALLKPSWGAEQWILEGWNQLTAGEKELINSRMAEMFKDGLPFELKHDRTSYIQTFSLLAQLEVLAIQIPLKFESKMTDPVHKRLMRNQLLDEIFHGLVFTKIVYMLCSPYALPPAYSEKVELLCNYVREESDPKIAVVLLNLISESWIEEFFYAFQRHGIAPKVFDTIIADEHRHVSEAELYSSIGLPDKKVIAEKIESMENQLSANIFMQFRYIVSFSTLVGYQAIIEYLQNLDIKHRKQLGKINLSPSDNWQYFVKFSSKLFSGFVLYDQSVNQVEQTPLRKLLMSQWRVPVDPTMVGQFNVNITAFNYFSGQYTHETLMLLILQATSLGMYENDYLRIFIDRSKLFTTQDAYVGLILKLPNCGDQLGTIVLKNCHELSLQDLARKVRSIRKKMTYCYKRCEQLEQENPELIKLADEPLDDMADDFYGCHFPASPFVSLSDLSSFGFSQAKSPLRPNESSKLTMLEVERKPVWNHQTEQFEPQDMLAMSISADHRAIDGSMQIRKVMSEGFERVFAKMQNEELKPIGRESLGQERIFKNSVEFMLENNLELGYKFLSFLRTMWSDDLFASEQVFSVGMNRKDLMNIANYYVKKALTI
ncbi:branched-chain alpha-keto acid dehydrogenase subunit E2 [Legionella massiliensis]|uniref:Branched-chain alpha-keto acid dehydrogenase subunit E2 n=1 Tax=Legionella massiliensis TaxID=1034943 RepID=A0A078KVF4_9GAMM|nr:2-oxo acid dehydrogenase subunit E2 [Legionella massiliensis]CDZ75754.1 branched-chain alpha-keto acid dehydrogenase subunit E2 [Legionella massiliensis]CEE11492.1 branched-chain alpha-keto acid dehydrogenase subunit E2 [Legionella massiliensis]